MKIEVDLPFDWCRDCALLDIETNTFYAGGTVYERNHCCKNEKYCIACEKARVRKEEQ